MLQCVSINDCSADPTQGCATCATDNVWNCATCTEPGYVVDDTGRVRAWFGWFNLVENKVQLGYGLLLFIGDWRGSCCAGAVVLAGWSALPRPHCRATQLTAHGDVIVTTPPCAACAAVHGTRSVSRLTDASARTAMLTFLPAILFVCCSVWRPASTA